MTIGSYEKFSDMHTARNQRDANIDWMEWEARLKPLRPWGRMAVEAGAFGLFLLSCIYVLPVILEVVGDWWVGR